MLSEGAFETWTGSWVGSRLGFETMASDHFRVEVDRREQPTFMIFSSPAMDWFPIGNETTAWATRGGILDLAELRTDRQRFGSARLIRHDSEPLIK